jgi:tyrosine-protein phosphatase YwqE
MTPALFYRTQAEQQQIAANAADLENVRERCQRASDAWTALARRSERNEAARSVAAAAKPMVENDEVA